MLGVSIRVGLLKIPGLDDGRTWRTTVIDNS